MEESYERFYRKPWRRSIWLSYAREPFIHSYTTRKELSCWWNVNSSFHYHVILQRQPLQFHYRNLYEAWKQCIENRKQQTMNSSNVDSPKKFHHIKKTANLWLWYVRFKSSKCGTQIIFYVRYDSFSKN